MKLLSPTRPSGIAAALAVSVLVALAALLLIMNFSQTQLLFPTDAVPPAGPLPPGAERVEAGTSDGERLHGVHFAPQWPASRANTLVLGFGGNAWNGQHVAVELHRLFPEAHVIAFHYRGYRPSTGNPSAAALIGDAPLLYDLAVGRTKAERVIAVGFSIGSGIAAHLAGQRQLDGLILVTPFDSLKSVASDLFPWLPIGPLFQHEMAAADALRNNQIPVAVIAAEQDDIIMPARTAALRRQVPNLVYDRTIGGAGHNDIYGRAEFEDAMGEAYSLIVSNKK